METIRYEIRDKVYTQDPLVLGQLRQFIGVLRDFSIPPNTTALDLVIMLGDDLPGVLAIVLGVEGVPMRDKDISALTEELRYAVSTEKAVQMVKDFFICNPVASLMEELTGWMERLATTMQTKSGSTTSSLCSAEGISPDATLSSGDLLSGT